MAYTISKRSLKASKEGVQLASRAILRFPTKIDFAAELEISRSTVQNFFAGKPIGRENFHKICQELELDWQTVAELPQQPASIAISHKLALREAETTQTIEQEQNQLSEDSTPTVESCDSLIRESRMQIESRILSMCETMRVLDMSRPMSVKDIYVDTKVYEQIKGRRRLDLDSQQADCFPHNTEPYSFKLNQELKLEATSGLEIAKRYSKLIVLGKPGSGKTMFLKYLVLQCLQGEFEPERIPIFIPVRDFVTYDPSLCLFDYIAKQIIKDGQPIDKEQVMQLLNGGKFFIVIDGLDEAKTTSHQVICRHLRQFTQWFPNNRYILSCRHGVQYCNFEQFTEVEIADFKSEQIVDFAAKWLDTEKTKISLSFLEKLEENSSIKEFATNPLLLTLLCILFEESRKFPTSRIEIYEEALDIMLKQWDVERIIERDGDGLSLQQEKELLYAIALKTFEKKQYFIKEVELKYYITNYLANLAETEISKINVVKVLKSIEAKHGLLVEQAKKVYSFSHLAFQEYLTAKKFVCEYNWPVSNAMLHHLTSHISEARWREIFLLVAEMSPQVEQLLQIMSEQVNSEIAQFPDIKPLLDWVNCKAESVITNNYAQKAEFEPVTIRAFYFSLGLSQILNCTGNNFSLVLSLDPNFSRKITQDLDLKLDLSLFHISNLAQNLKSIQCHSLTFQHVIDRAIAQAIIIKPELAQELQIIKQQLPSVEDSNLFWLWWHKEGQAWSNNINSLTIKYRNLGYQWQFTPQQQQALTNYYQNNLLLINCLNCNFNISPQIRQQLRHQLLKSTEINPTNAQEMEILMLQPVIA
jgi:predicted NACHT family NTPase